MQPLTGKHFQTNHSRQETPAHCELTRRYLAFINSDSIRDSKELEEMGKTLTFYFAEPHE